MYFETFKTEQGHWNPPGVARIASVKSLDPTTSDPTRAYASEVMVDLRGTKLFGKTTPGEHLSLLDISNPQTFTPEFIQNIKTQGCQYQFTDQDFENLGGARLKNFTIASPLGGERDKYGRPTGLVKLIVRRVEFTQQQDGVRRLIKGPMTNYLVGLKPGDPIVFAAPISHHFLGPTAPTPAIFFGVGTSITPYEGMLRTRFEQEKGPYGDTYLAIGHTRQALEYDRELFEKFARNRKNNFTYRPVFSREPEKSGGINYVQSLIQNPAEARKIFALVLNPKAQIYVSGFLNFDQQLLDALKLSARNNPALGVNEAMIESAWLKAFVEDRLHVEGEVRQDLQEGLQGY